MERAITPVEPDCYSADSTAAGDIAEAVLVEVGDAYPNRCLLDPCTALEIALAVPKQNCQRRCLFKHQVWNTVTIKVARADDHQLTGFDLPGLESPVTPTAPQTRYTPQRGIRRATGPADVPTATSIESSTNA